MFLAAVLLLPGTARADGDPASDVLLGESVFYPFTPTVSASLQTTLNAQTAAASRARFPLKVALIASPTDLGTIPELFGKPRQYAAFLDQEISFQGGQDPLLVVMPGGFGVSGLDRAAAAAVATLRKPVGATSDALAQAAILAVPKLAAASGHPIAAGSSARKAGGSGAGGSGAALPLVALAVAAIAAAGAILAVRSRRARGGLAGSDARGVGVRGGGPRRGAPRR